MKNTPIALLTACHLLWGVACADGAVTQDESVGPGEADTPGIVLFNLSNTGNNDSRPAYYGVTDDPHRFPDNQMFEAIERLPANNRLWTIYPDSFSQAGNRLRSWRDFDVMKWDGTSPLPTIRPESYIRRIEAFQKTGTLPKDLSGYSFLIDWENGATVVREMGLAYWSDASSPRFRTAWTTFRNQVVVTIDALKARFPTAFFTVYAGGSPARLIGQNKARTRPTFRDEEGRETAKYYFHDVAEKVRDTIRENFAAAMGPLLEAPDFHTVVCYDAYGPLDWNDRDGFSPLKNETYLIENFTLLKSNSTKPVYGVVGAFTSGNKNLSHQGESNRDYQMYWKDRGSWLKRTCRWLAMSQADGAIVWNGLDALIFKYLTLNVRKYSEINDETRLYLDPGQVGGWNQWISLDRQSGTLFAELAQLHGQPDARNYQSARLYYDNISLEQRQSDETIGIFLKTMSRTWNDYLLEDLLRTLRTGKVPLFIEKDPVVESDGDPTVTGSTLYVVDRLAGGLSSIDYQWMRNGDPVGDTTRNPVYVITGSDVGQKISCRVTYRSNDGTEAVVRIANFDAVITSPELATIEVIEDGRRARGIAGPRMAELFGVASISTFKLVADEPLILRSTKGDFALAPGTGQSWKIENGRISTTIDVPSESISIEGGTMTIADDTLLRTLLSGYRNVVTGITQTPTE